MLSVSARVLPAMLAAWIGLAGPREDTSGSSPPPQTRPVVATQVSSQPSPHPYARWAILCAEPLSKAGLGDVLAAEMSGIPGVELLERKQIALALRELGLGQALGGDVRTRLQLGRVLRADALVLLTVVTPLPESSREPIGMPDLPERPGHAKAREQSGDRVQVVIADGRQAARLWTEVLPCGPGQLQDVAASVVRRVVQTRNRLPEGLRQIIGVSPFVSRDLTHENDRYQAGFASILQNALAEAPGVATIETQEAQAIRQELAHSQDQDIRRVVPVLVEGEYQIRRRPAATSRPGQDSGQQAVDLLIRIQDSAGATRRIERRAITLQAAARFLAGELPSIVLQAAGEPGLRTFGLAEQFASLVARADAFAAVGAWQEAVGLREAAILLKPDDVAQRVAALRGYGSLMSPSGTYVPAGTRPAGLDPAWLGPEGRRAAWNAYREHVEYLVRNRLICLGDATEYAGRIYLAWPSPGPQTEASRDDRCGFLLEFFPRILSLPSAAGSSRQRDYRDWQAIVMTLAMHGADTTPGRIKDVDTDFVLKVMRDVIPPGQIDLLQLARSLCHGAVLCRQQPKYATFLERLARSDDPAIAFCAKYARLESRPPQEGLAAIIPSDVSSQLDELDRLYADLKDRLHLPNTDMDEIGRVLRLLREGLERPIGPPVGRRMPRPYVVRPPAVDQPPAPQESEAKEQRAGRLVFRPIQMRYRSKDGRTGPHLWPLASWRPGFGRGYLMCRPGLDVLWSPYQVAIMRTAGLWEEVLTASGTEFCDAAWDGQRIWMASRYKGILLLDADGQVLGRIAEAEGLPPATNGALLHPVEPGKVCIVGSFGVEHRAWCATVEWSPQASRVNVFHKATRLPDSPAEYSFGKEIDRTFFPRSLRECWRLSPDTPRRLLVDRGLMCPLLINLKDLGVGLAGSQDVCPYNLPPICSIFSPDASGPGHLAAGDVAGYEIRPDGTRDLASSITIPPGGQLYAFSGGEWLMHNGMVYVVRCNVMRHPRNEQLGTTWFRFEPATGRLERLSLDPIPPQFVQETTHAVSGHYGLILWTSWPSKPQFYQVLVSQDPTGGPNGGTDAASGGPVTDKQE